MKKAYEKPGMYVENFTLSQSIATACGANPNSTLGKPSYADNSTCGWDMGNFIIWVQEPACNDFEEPDAPLDGMCYNNPNGGTAIFSFS